MSADDRTPLIHRLEILAAAALFSTGGAVIKACSMTGWQVASFRSLIAAAALLLLVGDARKGWRPRTLVVGLAYAVTMILFVLANKLTTAAATIFLQSTAPLYILVLSPWLLRETLGRRDLLFMAALAVGMGLLLIGDTAPSTTAPDPGLGNLLGGVAGLFWGLTIMGLRALGRSARHSGETPVAAAACGNVIAGVVALPLALPVAASLSVDLHPLPRRRADRPRLRSADPRRARGTGPGSLPPSPCRTGAQPTLGVARPRRGPRLLGQSRRRRHPGRDRGQHPRAPCSTVTTVWSPPRSR